MEPLQIDPSTLLLQIANFLILAFLLTRFFFKPLKAMLDKRSAQATKLMDEAEESAGEAEKLRLEYEKMRDSIDAQFSALKNEARIVIDETRQQMLKDVYEEIEALRARAREEIEQQRADALRMHRSKIGELVTMLVTRMIQDVLNPQVHQAYLDAFLDQLRAIQLDGRIAGGEEPVLAELITAIPATKEDQGHVVALLESMMTQPVEFVFQVDPHLIAGAMMRLGDLLIDGSLQGQIVQLRDRYEAEIG